MNAPFRAVGVVYARRYQDEDIFFVLWTAVNPLGESIDLFLALEMEQEIWIRIINICDRRW